MALGDSPVGHEDEEEKLLKQAIALSLEGAEENEEENDTEEDVRVDVGEKGLHFKHDTGEMYNVVQC